MRSLFYLLPFLLLSLRPALAGEQPNIVFLFADDQTTRALSCYGNEAVQTPNIDALARRGTRFENAFVSQSICWVSRTTILSGLTGLDIVVFTIASILARGLRFFLVAGLLWYFGDPIRRFIEKYLNWLAVAFVVLLAGGFALVKYVI